MTSARRQQLETLLQAHRLQGGFGAAFAPLGRRKAGSTPLGQAALAGAITELVGGGATSLGCRWAAWATAPAASRPYRRGRVAWIDPQDAFDPASAAQAGVALEQLLWLRGESQDGAGRSGPSASPPSRSPLPVWLELLYLCVHSGDFRLVVLDLARWPSLELRRLPRSGWFRLLRAVERVRTTAVAVLSPTPRIAAGAARVLYLHRQTAEWKAFAADRRPIFTGVRLHGTEEEEDAANPGLLLPLELRP